MKEIKIGLLQQHNTANSEDNMRRLAEGIEKLAKDGAQLERNHQYRRKHCRAHLEDSVRIYRKSYQLEQPDYDKQHQVRHELSKFQFLRPSASRAEHIAPDAKKHCHD